MAVVNCAGTTAVRALAVNMHSHGCWALPLAHTVQTSNSSRIRGMQMHRWMGWLQVSPTVHTSVKRVGWIWAHKQPGGRGDLAVRVPCCGYRVSSQVNVWHGGL